MQIHGYCKRLVRCADGSNHQFPIAVIICEQAQRAGTQYTKRMLPGFVIPECNIRLDLVLQLREQHPTERSARGASYALIGSVCERTIARHLRCAQDNIAATLLEVNELVADLPQASFARPHLGQDCKRRLTTMANELSRVALEK